MGLVETNVPHLKINLGVWRKFYALSGGYVDNLSKIGRCDLWSVGLSPDFWVVIDAAKTWTLPFPVIMVLWALRERQLENGGFLRIEGLSKYVETGSVYRYVELAILSGETISDDGHVKRALQWLMNHQLENGALPTHEMSSVGEVGTTARAVRIMAMAIEKEMKIHGKSKFFDELIGSISRAISYIGEHHHREGNIGWWSRSSRDNGKGIVGASSLAVLALLKVLELSEKLPTQIDIPKETIKPTLRWLLTEFNGVGWPESKGEPDKIDTTFYASWALLWAQNIGIISPDIRGLVRTKITAAFKNIHKLTRDTLYDVSFALRFLTLLTKNRKSLAIEDEELRAWIQRYLHKLEQKMKDIFKSGQDAYLMELVGITLVELDDALVELGMDETRRELRKFPGLPPSFMLKEILEKSNNASDVLYLLISPFTSWKPFISLVDILVRMDILTTIIGVTMGLFFIMSGLSDRFLELMLSYNGARKELLAFILAVALTVVWMSLKIVPEKSRLEAVMSYTLSLVAAYLYIRAFFNVMVENVLTLSSETIPVIKTMLVLAIIIDVTVKLLDRTVFSRILGG